MNGSSQGSAKGAMHSKLNGHHSMTGLHKPASGGGQKVVQERRNGYVSIASDAGSLANGVHVELGSNGGIMPYPSSGSDLSDETEGSGESNGGSSAVDGQIASVHATRATALNAGAADKKESDLDDAAARLGRGKNDSQTGPPAISAPGEGITGKAVSSESFSTASKSSASSGVELGGTPPTRITAVPKLVNSAPQPIGVPAANQQPHLQRLRAAGPGEPMPVQHSPVLPASTPKPGDLLLPVEAPMPLQQASKGSSVPATMLGPAAIPVPEPQRSLSVPPTAVPAWSEEGGWPHIMPMKRQAGHPQDGISRQGVVRYGQTPAQRNAAMMDRLSQQQQHAMQMPSSSSGVPSPSAASLPAFSGEPSILQRSRQQSPASMATVAGHFDPAFLSELQHQMLLQSSQQQRGGHQQQHAREQRLPVRTRSLPKLQEQQQQQQRLPNGKISASSEQWHHHGRQSSPKVGGSYGDERGAGQHTLGKQPGLVQHTEAFMHLPPVATARLRQDQGLGGHQRGSSMQPLQRQVYSLPTTPVNGLQRGYFNASTAPVQVKLSEGGLPVWIGAEDAMQLVLAQQASMPAAAAAGRAQRPEELGKAQDAAAADSMMPPPPPPPRGIAGSMHRQQSAQVLPAQTSWTDHEMSRP